MSKYLLNQYFLTLTDLSEYERLKRYIRYNDDLVYYGSTTTVTDKYAFIMLQTNDKAEWLIKYFLEQFENLYLGEIQYPTPLYLHQ